MKRLANQKGLTLVEIILSLAIIGLIAMSSLGMFSLGFKGVFAAGTYSKVQYQSQKAIENKVAGLPVPGSAVMSNVTADTTVTLNFGLPNNVVVQGKVEKIKYYDGRHHVTLATFVPN